MTMANRKVFNDSVVQLPADGLHPQLGLLVQPAAAAQKDETLTLHFSFQADPSAEAELARRVARGEVVPLDEQDSKYAVDPGEVDRLKAWLTNEGFTIEQVTRDGIYASAASSQIAKSLKVNMVRVTHNGFTNMAAQDAPSLPSAVAGSVQNIGGLQPFLRAHRHGRVRSPSAANRVSLGKNTGGLAPQSVNSAFEPPYLVSEIRKAYNIDGIQATGAGQTIAILIDTVPNPVDLAAFWQSNGLPLNPGRIQTINVRGGALDAPEGEETLDVAWSSGIAPGATIRVYATGSLAWVDLDRALDRIIADIPANPGMRQLSISLGLGDQYMSAGEVATQHQKYLRLAAAGVNVFVSSGDAGSNPDPTGHSSNGPRQAEYPSSDTYVVGVGGTSLRMTKAGAIASEVAWPGSGGGLSRFFSRPSWQKGKGVPSSSKRMVPDVSLAADPGTGAFLILNGQSVQYGGTSWSAPVWAGICALMNEARIKSGKAALPFLNPLLYKQSGTACFRDIVKGSNGFYSSVAGYDRVTGLGVPNAAKLASTIP
jgi:kumamolisin